MAWFFMSSQKTIFLSSSKKKQHRVCFENGEGEKKYSEKDKNRFYLICTNGQSLKDIKEWLFVYLHRMILGVFFFFGGMPYALSLINNRSSFPLFHIGRARFFSFALPAKIEEKNSLAVFEKPERILFLASPPGVRIKKKCENGSKVLYYYDIKFIFPQLRCARKRRNSRRWSVLMVLRGFLLQRW